MIAIVDPCNFCGCNETSRKLARGGGNGVRSGSPTSVVELTGSKESERMFKCGCNKQAKGHFLHAITFYMEAIKLNPTHVEAHFNMGSAYQELGAMEEAEKFYKRSLALQPDLYLAYYNLGYIYQDSDRMPAAIDCFHQAARIQPHDADAHINLGLAYRKEGMLREAVRSYKAAIQADPENTMAYFNLGNVYQDLRQYDSAITSFCTVLRLDRGHVDAMFNLGIAYQDRATVACEAPGPAPAASSFFAYSPSEAAPTSSQTPSKRGADMIAALRCFDSVQRMAPDCAEATEAGDYMRGLIGDASGVI